MRIFKIITENALLDKMIAYYAERFGSRENMPPVPEKLDGLVGMTMRMVDITIHDEKIVMTRKMLTIEQFRDDRARELATMTKEQFDAEISKGMDDIEQGRVFSAEEVAAELRRDFGV